LVALLVRLFPAAFRRQFGEDIIEQVLADYARSRTRGPWRASAFTLSAVADLVRSAAAERWNPMWSSQVGKPEERRGEGMTMSEWTRDFRYAARTLRRAPGYAAVTIVTLGLAIGANAGIFSVVDTVLLDPLPYPEADRLVYIAASAPGSDLPDEFGVSAEFYVQYREESELLEDLATVNSFTNTMRAGDRVERIRMSTPTTSVFNMLGVTPILGRLPVEEDESGVVVISHALWTTWFGADPAVIGRSYHVGGADRTVIGVMGPDFWFPDDETLLWIPAVIRQDGIVPGRFGIGLVGRLTPGATYEALSTELTRLARRLPERFGGSANYARIIEQHRPIVRSVEEALLGDIAGPLWVLLGAVGIVLLIACANVANLVAVRSEHRQRDLAVRRALGADRGQLVRTQLAEALVLAGCAGALAIVLAWVTIPLFIRAAPTDVPRLTEAALSGSTILFTVGLSVFAALLCGLVPALRSSTNDLTRLREGGRGSTRRRTWGRDALVVGQTALALVLLIGSGLLVRSFIELRSVDPGYDTEDVFTFQIAPEGDDLRDAESYARFHMDFMERLAALPGVASVGIVENVPLNEGVASGRFLTEATASDVDGGTLLGYTWAAGDYFGTMGIDVLEGRPFERADQTSGLGSVVVSRAAADLLWPGQDAIGRRVKLREAEPWEMVVGVVEDVMQYGFRNEPQPLVYYPLVGQGPGSRVVSSPAYVVKTGRADDIAGEIRALAREVAPTAPMYRVFTMAGLAAQSMGRLSFTMLTLGIASMLALVLGAVGLFGVLSFVVAQRTQEIGVRMALGAEARRVHRMVVAQGARVVILGVLIGLGVAIGTTRVLGSLLFGVEASDAGTFVGMSVTMVLVGLLASYLPARRASSVDPIESLKGE
jgi:predicted permease